MDDRQKMRASDAERQAIVERLRAGLDDGRLKMHEYLERMEQAYDAVTYGELEALCHDLPETAVTPPPPEPKAPAPAAAAAPARAQPAEAARRGAFARLPAVLKVLWTIWLAAVSVNVVVWVIVSGTAGHVIYPWPLWVAGPYGAVLLAISASAAHWRRSDGPAAPLPPSSGS